MTILDAERLFPNWSHALRMRWVRAAAYAANFDSPYKRELQRSYNLAQRAVVSRMTPRTLRESGL